MPIIVTRAQWGARQPDPGPFPTTGWSRRTGFVVHYSAADADQTVRAIQNYQMDSNGWRDIGYNFLVRDDGTIYEGAQGTWLAVGAHAAGHNTENIGVCAIGTNADITDAQKRSIRWLYDEACRRAGRTLAMRYHSLYANDPRPGNNVTSCPGDNLRAWVRASMPVTTPVPPPSADEEDDMKPYLMVLDADKVTDQPDGAVYALFGGGAVRWIGLAEYTYLRSQGVPVTTATRPDEVDRLARAAALAHPAPAAA